MPLKKVFPVIIALITLSLMGIIFVQYNWLRIMLADRTEEFSWKVVSGVIDASQQLVQQKSGITALRSYRQRQGISLPSPEVQLELMNPSGVAQKFTQEEVAERLRLSFHNQGLDHLHFEFAIISNTFSSYAMKTALYEQLREQNKEDSTSNLIYFYPLQPTEGSEWENLSPNEELSVIVPNVRRFVLQQMKWMIFGAVFFTLLIIAAFYITVAALLQQKKISEIKNDFINNMTHEFKTPLATISLAVDALKNEKVLGDVSKMEYFRGIIKEENQRMNKQVETILQAAISDRQAVNLRKQPLHVHPLIGDLLNHYQLQIGEKNGSAELVLNAQQDLIQADPEHFRNLISNLIDNAIKYAGEQLRIRIVTQSNGSHLTIRVEDQGIGMNKETQKRIFEKFYRAHTGNLHNVKGFGLGLSYVKEMVQAHGGKIRVESSPGKGSVFTLEFPQTPIES
jgi:two-component system phosphate regulon sensor histidine kinase PhoR